MTGAASASMEAGRRGVGAEVRGGASSAQGVAQAIRLGVLAREEFLARLAPTIQRCLAAERP
ncbi:hypothetical protein [Streptomyces sp. NPDC058620]|uniref:hypothetical protein n=1 Tax=Streptomyces sp. NPDC058620 TaxID=3346560 RepID=UPI00365E1964